MRRVYTYLTIGILFAVAGGLAALYAGPTIEVRRGYEALEIPFGVALGVRFWWGLFALYFASALAATWLRKVRGVNLVALFGFTFVTGLVAAPAIFFAQMSASSGATLSASPVRDAFLLTFAAFAGLTSYAFITKRDFSYLGGFLSMGLWVLIGASILGFFFHSEAFQLAIASVGVLLFGGFILFDTSRILRAGDDADDAVGAALGMYLNIFNLFMFLLRILGASRDR